MSHTTNIILLLLHLCQAVILSRADWSNPRLLPPDPKDDVVHNFYYNDEVKAADIQLEEEVTYAVNIATLNYKGSEVPAFGPLEGGKHMDVLGAELRKNQSTSEWSVWITKPQDYETLIMQDYKFSIIASSPPYPLIALYILNIDDNKPIIRSNEPSCQIKENYAGESNCTYTISDADGWIQDVNITLSSIQQNDEKKHFELVLLNGSGAKDNYERIGVLNVTESLDFEEVSMHMLLIQAIDKGKNEGSLTTIVEVQDEPDEPPKWNSLIASVNIDEKSTKNVRVSAVDGDVLINAEINYRIEPENTNDTDYFVVDPKTGVITINKIDRDAVQREIFRFLIFAYEVPEPESIINATIVVMVEDVNDHFPTITLENSEVKIKEETYMTLEFESPIIIEDPDLAENAQFSVSLTDDSKHKWSSAFLVIPTSGYQRGVFTISVVNATLLDYEDENWKNIDIKIKAVELKDPSHIGIKNINIQLIDWNDEVPIFDKDTPLNISVKEDVAKDYSIATVHATDRDAGDVVKHTLVGQKTLKINETTGTIVTNQIDALDYELMDTVVTQITASDQGGHHTYTTLTINVIDVNDVPPKLYLPREIPPLEEEKEGLEVKAVISASDVDTEAELFFSIDWDNSKAHKKSVPVDPSLYRGHLDIRTTYPDGDKRNALGILYASRRIDYETFDIMFLSISVTDSTTCHNENTTSSSLTLNILDINDNDPVFKEVEPMRIEENSKAGTRIGAISAIDADDPPYNNVTYFIQPINETKSDLVDIDPLSGQIGVKLDKAIDAEEYTYIYYNVTATDGTRNASKVITIFVVDQNDKVPYLRNELFNSTISIPEKSPNGTKIVDVYAADDDRDYPYNNVSFLMNYDYSSPVQYFSMGRNDGRLVVAMTQNNILDRDFGPAEFTVNLKLRDNYFEDHVSSVPPWNSNAFDYTVNVILLDINDQKPLLPKLEPFTVSESTTKGKLIGTVTASDADDPKTNNTKVTYRILSIKNLDNTTDMAHDENCQDLFTVETRGYEDADISSNCDLRGHFGNWAVQLYAQDLGTDPCPQNDTNEYVIQVTDYNYNDPVIEFPIFNKKLALMSEQSINSQLTTYDGVPLNDFKASDKDYGDSGTVNLSLPITEADNRYFKLVPRGKNTGQLQLTQEVDLKVKTSYKLTVVAEDKGVPSKSVSQDTTVVFIDTLGPEFDKNDWTIWIKENKTGLGFSVTIPQAHDMVDIENGGGTNTVEIYYYFMNEDPDTNFFHLDKTTRNLTVIKELDREMQESMTLYVVATTDKNGPPRNPLDASILNITIVVLDENDNSPVFYPTSYSAGVAAEDSVDKILFTVKATDADLNDTLTYSIADSISISDSSLSAISKPFWIDPNTGDVLLKFSVRTNMKGYFSINIFVHDMVNHVDKASLQVYIILESNRVVFTFNNVASYIKQENVFIINSFNEAFKYLCNIDEIKTKVDSNNQVVDNMTSLKSHFINPTNHLPINADTIVVLSGDLQIIGNLKNSLLARSIYLVDVPTGAATDTTDIQEIIHWVLVCLTSFFFTCSMALVIIYIIRTRRLMRRLDKLAITHYGSQESNLDKAGVVPTTNQFAGAGSNPMWKTSDKTAEDNISQASGDSDLIGIENNPDFGYTNAAFEGNYPWEDSSRGMVNPVLANQNAIFEHHDYLKSENLDQCPQEETIHNNNTDEKTK